MFGNVLSDSVQHLMEYMGLQHAGFVARPLYACTKRLENGQMCMNVASMSKFIQHRDGRSHYRCGWCRQKECADSAPVSDSVPLRVLDLYILVRDGSKATFMRSSPHLSQAMPGFVSHANGKFYHYNDAESEAIWCYASSYEGKPQ